MAGRATLLFLFAAFLAAAPAAAQPRFGIQGGLLGSELTWSPGEPFFTNQVRYRPSWSAGLDALVPLGPRWEIETGLRYVEYGESFRWSATFIDSAFFSGDTSVTVTTFGARRQEVWRYVTVPILLRVHPAPARGLFVALGPEIGRLSHVMLRSRPLGSNDPWIPGLFSGSPKRGQPFLALAEIFDAFGTPNATAPYRRWYAAGAGAIGWTTPLARHEAEVQLRYTLGLVDILRSTNVARRTRAIEALGTLRW